MRRFLLDTIGKQDPVDNRTKCSTWATMDAYQDTYGLDAHGHYSYQDKAKPKPEKLQRLYDIKNTIRVIGT
eukprot:4976818-Alexandrium_andersonii.AAC.1